MNKLIDKAKKLLIREKDAAPVPSQPVDRTHLFEDLRIFLAQLAQSINGHLDYERRIGTGLSNDSDLILHFEIEDYVREVFEFLNRKGLSGFDHDTVVSATIEVLVPPRSVRDQITDEHRRRLFAGLLVRIAEQSGMPIPKLTRLYYDRLSSRPDVNGVQSKQVIDIYEAALKEITIAREEKEEERSFDPSQLLEQTLVACGATSERSLRRIVSRRPGFEFFSALLVWSAIVGIVLLDSGTVASLIEATMGFAVDRQAFALLVMIFYMLVVFLFYRRMQYVMNRRKTLVRVFNVIVSSVSMSIKDVDDVLEQKYGTNVGNLKKALLPRSFRRGG